MFLKVTVFCYHKYLHLLLIKDESKITFLQLEKKIFPKVADFSILLSCGLGAAGLKANVKPFKACFC